MEGTIAVGIRLEEPVAIPLSRVGGKAARISESGYRLNIPRMFAALVLLSVAGIVIYFALALFSHLLLRRWHESAVAREG